MTKQKYLFSDIENTDVWNTLRDVFHLAAKTQRQKTRLGQLTREFRDELGVTSDTIRLYTEIYCTRKPWKMMMCTPDAVLKYWGDLEHAAKARTEVQQKRDEEFRKAAERCKRLEAEARASGRAVRK